MSLGRNAASFLRWRLVPVRYAGRVARLRPRHFRRLPPVRTALAAEIAREGYAIGPVLGAAETAAINERYRPRIAGVARKDDGHPFVNLLTAADLSADDPVVRLAFSPQILDVAADYFGGACILDSIQVLYSYPTEMPLRESQKWHKDYGDSRSFHCIIYLNDVLTEADGPFVFVNRSDTGKIGAAPIIRRIPDDRFLQELGPGKVRSFLAPAGSSVYVDPAACYHYGSRCRNDGGRLALFVTFNSTTPFVAPMPIVSQNRRALFEIARSLRSDLSVSFLESLLELS